MYIEDGGRGGSISNYFETIDVPCEIQTLVLMIMMMASITSRSHQSLSKVINRLIYLLLNFVS